MGSRSEVSFRSSDFSGPARRDPKHGRRPPEAETETAHDPCERGDACAGRKRILDPPGWLPAPAAQHVCTACQLVLSTALAGTPGNPDDTGLPGAYTRLARMSTDPVRRASGVRVPPGSRILVNPQADALMRDIADITGGWAARLRALLQLSRHDYPHGSADQVREDCRAVAQLGRDGGANLSPLLALPAAPALRTWHYLPGRTGTRPAPVPCRRCGIPVSPAPSGRHWWPAVCAHPSAVITAYDGDADGIPVPSAWACSACSRRLPRGWTAASHCDHEPSRGTAPAPAKTAAARGPRTRADVEEEIGDLEVVRAGDDWVTAVTSLHGGQGACELIEVRIRATRLLQENPAPVEILDGIPCRDTDCGAMGLERAQLPAGPADPDAEDPYSRCPACGDVMDRPEYAEWTAWYAKWAEGGADPVCVRCQVRGHLPADCLWPQCACRARGHAAV